jgi:hypothetical protein
LSWGGGIVARAEEGGRCEGRERARNVRFPTEWSLSSVVIFRPPPTASLLVFPPVPCPFTVVMFPDRFCWFTNAAFPCPAPRTPRFENVISVKSWCDMVVVCVYLLSLR